MNCSDAIKLASEKLAALDAESVCARTGAVWDGKTFLVPWLSRLRPLDSGKPQEQVLWLHYLTSCGGKRTGELTAYRDIHGARFYESLFYARAVRPVVKRFGGDTDGLLRAGLKLGGVKADFGDCAVTVPCFPYVPVTYIVWRGDDEMPAEAGVLFDKSAAGWFPAEDLVVLASLSAYELINTENLKLKT